MQEKYDHKKIEAKWQKEWEEKGTHKAEDPTSPEASRGKKPKFYALVEFPYPSGDGLHVGHPRPYIGLDLIARKRRMEGFNVLYPMGWDAFGLPTENYAIKTGAQPEEVTKKNIENFRRQIKLLGTSFDWSREINTTDPKYYKWTQWLFLKFLEHGLAYKDKISINWCPKDKIGLANEEVVNGKCERCGTPVEKREKEQWMLRITKYAERLHKDLDDVDYLEKIKLQQRNWIGKSEGTLLKFKIKNSDGDIEVFTTRADTLFGVTYLVVAPEHKIIERFKDSKIENWEEIQKYVKETKQKSEIERMAEEKEKTGVEIKGVTAINPANGEEVPVFVADYVLGNYGTGAVMAVPAHDERDFAFAQKYDLPVKWVILPRRIDRKNPHVPNKEIVFRNAVIAILKNPKNGKILCLKWKKQPWTTFIMGGIEEGENPVQAGLREIAEETGYKKVRLTKMLGGPTQSEFYAAHKGVNRIAHTFAIEYELENEERDEISNEEKEIHEAIWMDPKDITEEKMTHIETDMILERMKNGVKAYTGEGILKNSGEFDMISSEEAREKITEKFGEKVVKFKLRDWVFSRQRYWGEPIPVVHCGKCGIVPLPEKDLPLELPKVKNYQPTDNGESPLAAITEWVNTECPKCGGPAKRETDTMPNWAGSSWYFLRYVDPNNDKKFADFEKLKYWLGSPEHGIGGGVDWYNGGMEHTTLHLLYSRFWNKFFYDIGLVPTSEPYKKRTSHGFILASNGEKMSKSRGNVINPDNVVEMHGADTFRLYEMFMGPFDQMISWSDDNIIGVRRFVERLWKLAFRVSREAGKGNKKFEALLNKTIKNVSEDIESMSFNTAVSDMMILANEMEEMEEIPREYFEKFITILFPFAPHITEEMWHNLGNKTLLATENWPEADESKIKEEEVIIVVQINGKVRSQFEARVDISENEAKNKALSLPEVQKWLDGKETKKVIFVSNKIINFVV